LPLFPPHFSQISRGLSILFIFSKNLFFVTLILCMIFWSLFHWFWPLFFIIFLLLRILGLACSTFSRSLRYSIRSFIWDLSVLLIYAFLASNFPFRTAFAVSHRFW
jgi:hypothetical protein